MDKEQLTRLAKQVKKNKDRVQSFDKDLEYIYDKIREFRTDIENLQTDMDESKAELAEYIRGMTDRQYQTYQALLDSQGTDKTQKDVAEELEMDEAAVSRLKKEFKQNNIL
jgi:DNA-directed RNA polymerase specialized sigma subunit